MYVHIHTIILGVIFNTWKHKSMSRANELAERTLRIAKLMHVTGDGFNLAVALKISFCVLILSSAAVSMELY